jgi:hypothetical protein
MSELPPIMMKGDEVACPLLDEVERLILKMLLTFSGVPEDLLTVTTAAEQHQPSPTVRPRRVVSLIQRFEPIPVDAGWLQDAKVA